MSNRRITAAIAGAWLLALAPATADAASTIDPTVPAQIAPLNSAPIRANFLAAYNDVNRILNMYAGATPPTNPFLFQLWGDTSTNPYTVRQFDSAQWVATGTLNPSTHAYIPGFGTIAANTVIAGPTSGSPANATARALVGADLPLPTTSSLGGVEAVNQVTHQWVNSINSSGVPQLSQPAYSDISGTLPPASCPTPGASSLGCVFSLASVSHNFLTSIGTSGAPTQAQPAFTDISGVASAAQLPNPTATTLGGIESYAAVTHQWINTISTSGVPSSSQPAAADLSDGTNGSGAVVLTTSPSLVTPSLGVASATSLNKVTITAPATGATLTIANGKTLTASNSLAFTGTDSTSFAFPGSSDTVVTLGATQTLTAKTLTSPTISGGTIDNTVVGGTTKAAGGFTALTATVSFTATNLVTNADLVNQSTTVNGQTCTLGSTCTVTAAAKSGR